MKSCRKSCLGRKAVGRVVWDVGQAVGRVVWDIEL